MDRFFDSVSGDGGTIAAVAREIELSACCVRLRRAVPAGERDLLATAWGVFISRSEGLNAAAEVGCYSPLRCLSGPLLYAVVVLLFGWLLSQQLYAIAARAGADVNMWLLAKLCGLTYTVEGTENIPPGAHVSMWKHSSAWETHRAGRRSFRPRPGCSSAS